VKKCITQLHHSFLLPTEARIKKAGQCAANNEEAKPGQGAADNEETKAGQGAADNEETSETHEEEGLELPQPNSHQELLSHAALLRGAPREAVVNFIASDLLLRRQFRIQGYKLPRDRASCDESAEPEHNRYVALSMEEQDRYMAAFRLKVAAFTAEEGRAPSDEDLETIELFARTAAVCATSQ